MKAKQFKRPGSWEDRHVILDDGVLSVPDYYNDFESFTFPGWEAPTVFGRIAPVHVEFCSGNGTWIAEKAQAHPEINWVAVEIRFDRIQKIWAKKKNLHLDNLFIVHGEGLASSRHYFPEGSVSAVYVNFPDPWPKKRHAKHRIIQAPFSEEVIRLLENGGCCTLVTDDPVYSEQMQEVMQAQKGLVDLFPEQGFSTEVKGYGSSFFYELWLDKGRTIRYHQYTREARA